MPNIKLRLKRERITDYVSTLRVHWKISTKRPPKTFRNNFRKKLKKGFIYRSFS